MKVPPKRKGNEGAGSDLCLAGESLNESPSEKEGKLSGSEELRESTFECLNESPSEKEGK